MKKIRATEDYKENIIKDLTEQINNAKTITEIEKVQILKDKTSFKNVKTPEIYIPADVMEKMYALVDESATECQWHGLVQRAEKFPNIFYIYDVLVFPQKNTAASTDSDEEKYTTWLMEIMTDEDETKFDNLRLHGHSHVNMGVYSSSIDDKYQEDILANVKDDDYYIFFVLNKKRDICILLYDFSQNIMFETKEIKLHITSNETVIKDWAKEQLDKYVEKKTWFSTKNWGTVSYPYSTPYNDETESYGYDFNPYNSNPAKQTKKHTYPSIERRY